MKAGASIESLPCDPDHFWSGQKKVCPILADWDAANQARQAAGIPYEGANFSDPYWPYEKPTIEIIPF